jgi:hypothetical protein
MKKIEKKNFSVKNEQKQCEKRNQYNYRNEDLSYITQQCQSFVDDNSDFLRCEKFHNPHQH